MTERAGPSRIARPRWHALGVLAAATALVTVAAGTPGPARAASLEPVHTLLGTTAINGTEAAVLRVRVPEDATLLDPAFHPGSVVVAGKGSFVGFALTSTEPEPRRVLVGGRLPWALPGGDPAVVALIPLKGFPFDDRYVIPAGEYDLYLLTDGDVPVSITLALRGLAGASSLTPTEPVRYETRMPPARVGAAEASNYYTSGDHAPLVTQGLLFASRHSRYSAFVSERVETCIYARATDAQTDFGPGCLPDGNGLAFIGSDLTAVATGGSRIDYGGIAGIGPGTFGIGFNQQSVGKVEDVEHFALWLSYGTEAAAAQAPPPSPAVSEPPALALGDRSLVPPPQLPATGPAAATGAGGILLLMVAAALRSRPGRRPAGSEQRRP